MHPVARYIKALVSSEELLYSFVEECGREVLSAGLAQGVLPYVHASDSDRPKKMHV
jgi:hypothetical protein